MVQVVRHVKCPSMSSRSAEAVKGPEAIDRIDVYGLLQEFLLPSRYVVCDSDPEMAAISNNEAR